MLRSHQLESRVETLNKRFAKAEAKDVLRAALSERSFGKTALVSSFGAESAVLLHMVAQINNSVPVLFIDTEFLFPETLDYLADLAIKLDLQDIRRVVPDPGRLAVNDSDKRLHQIDKDACCHLRKTQPLNRALGEFGSWITGRKRYQSTTRKKLSLFELDSVTNRVKINPLYQHTAADLRNYMIKNNLPAHPLVAQGYPSIGCTPCTTPVAQGEDPRAGRWRDQEKTECGIHFGARESEPKNESAA